MSDVQGAAIEATPNRPHPSAGGREVSAAYPTVVWISRIRGLQSHLRLIAQSCADSDNPHVQRIGRQAVCGIAEADRYLADPDWSTDPCQQEEPA